MVMENLEVFGKFVLRPGNSTSVNHIHTLFFCEFSSKIFHRLEIGFILARVIMRVKRF